MGKVTSKHDTFGGQHLDFAGIGHSLVSNAMPAAGGAFTDNLLKLDNLSELLPGSHELPESKTEADSATSKSPDEQAATAATPDATGSLEEGNSEKDKKKVNKFFAADIAIANAKGTANLKLTALQARPLICNHWHHKRVFLAGLSAVSPCVAGEDDLQKFKAELGGKIDEHVKAPDDLREHVKGMMDIMVDRKEAVDAMLASKESVQQYIKKFHVELGSDTKLTVGPPCRCYAGLLCLDEIRAKIATFDVSKSKEDIEEVMKDIGNSVKLIQAVLSSCKGLVENFVKASTRG
eukprot:5406729-Amphidinium_carterae.1